MNEDASDGCECVSPNHPHERGGQEGKDKPFMPADYRALIESDKNDDGTPSLPRSYVESRTRLALRDGARIERQRILALIAKQEAGLTDLDKLIVLTDLRDRIGDA